MIEIQLVTVSSFRSQVFSNKKTMVAGGKYPLANRKATLTRYLRTEKGWRHCPVVLTKGDPPRIKAVVIDGKEINPNKCTGIYRVRHYDGARILYDNAGYDPIEGVNQWRQTQLAMTNPDLAIPRPASSHPS